MRRRNVVWGVLLLAVFLLMIFLLSLYLRAKNSTIVCDSCNTCEANISIFDIIPLFGTIALFIGMAVYYIMSRQVEHKEETLKKSSATILQLLNADERKVMDVLLANNGQVLQAEVTRLPGMSKLKAHRIVQRLRERGVISVEKYGKTNLVKLKTEIKEGLL